MLIGLVLISSLEVSVSEVDVRAGSSGRGLIFEHSCCCVALLGTFIPTDAAWGDDSALAQATYSATSIDSDNLMQA